MFIIMRKVTIYTSHKILKDSKKNAYQTNEKYCSSRKKTADTCVARVKNNHYEGELALKGQGKTLVTIKDMNSPEEQ